jgi:hypothetical protein
VDIQPLCPNAGAIKAKASVGILPPRRMALLRLAFRPPKPRSR